MHQKVMGLMPGHAIYLGCGFDPQSGHVGEATDQCFSPILKFLSLSLSPPLSLSLKSIHISTGEVKKRKEGKGGRHLPVPPATQPFVKN